MICGQVIVIYHNKNLKKVRFLNSNKQKINSKQHMVKLLSYRKMQQDCVTIKISCLTCKYYLYFFSLKYSVILIHSPKLQILHLTKQKKYMISSWPIEGKKYKPGLIRVWSWAKGLVCMNFLVTFAMHVIDWLLPNSNISFLYHFLPTKVFGYILYSSLFSI